MSEPTVLLDVDRQGVARITLNRPRVHNALDEAMIGELTQWLRRVGADAAIRLVILEGAGASFCAGADLDWMRRSADYPEAQNLAEAEDLALLMSTLHGLPKPTIALIRGSVFGGGLGLVACCDIALAAENAVFCFSEVKLGLIPAVISPYVVAAIGSRAARRFMLSAERFEGTQAERIGLVHACLPEDELQAELARTVDNLLLGGPEAHESVKRLLADVADRPIDAGLRRETARRIAERRASDEGREGLRAFAERRRPRWVPDQDS